MILMGGRGGSSGLNLGPVGTSSPNGEMKKVTLYHGSFADFNEFDRSKNSKRSNDAYGEGYYFTSDPKQARLYGDIIYEVDVKYSTDRRTAKKTGREQDFSYNQKTGYWVIPLNKAQNIRIKRKRRVN